MKRRNGAGSIEVLPSGKARIAFMQNGRRRRKTFATEALAARALAAIDALAAAGDVEPGGETFGQAFERFLDARELGGRVRGIAEERHLARARVEPAPFYDRPMRSVRRADVALWVEDLLGARALRGGRRERRETDRTLSRETVAKALRLVRACFAWAVQRDELDANPAALVRVPRHVRAQDVDDPWTFLTADEIALLFKSALSDRDRALFALAIYAGPRQGELFSLRWEDVHEADVERPRVVIRRARNGPTKSGRVREVPLFVPAQASIARWRETTGGRGLVFPNPEGKAYGKKYAAGWPDKPQRRGKKGELVVTAGVKSRAGIVRDVRFHDLRHTCASHLVMGTWGATWTLEQVKALMGHSSIRMTERYAHLGADSIHAKARETRLPTVAHERPQTLRMAEPASEVSPIETSGESGLWALQDLNLRLPPCESGSALNGCAQLQAPWATRGQRPPEAAAAARELIAAVASGHVDAAALRRLAAAVLDDPAVSLALEVRAGGPHALRRAIELAAIILASAVQTDAGDRVLEHDN